MTKPAFNFKKCFENGVTDVTSSTTFIPGLKKTGKLIQKFTWRERDITQISMHAQEYTACFDLLRGLKLRMKQIKLPYSEPQILHSCL